jgi:mono/diheme cytochrome c family protein
MRLFTIAISSAFGALVAVAGCTTEEAPDTTDPPASVALPCDVAPIIQMHCLSCHGAPVRSGAPNPLSLLGFWQTPAASDPAVTNGELAVTRMNDAASPMPPAGLLSPEQIAVVAEWVAAGMPGGDCDAATPDDPALDAMPMCTSMDMWPAPQHFAVGKGADEMFPGGPCIDCHVDPSAYGQPEPGPLYDLAGTIYATAHEPDNCAGLDGLMVTDVVIHIEDANGAVWDLQPNRAGNFLLLPSGLVPPYSAKVISPGGVRAMSLKPMSGDCNLCHTDNGSSGPDDPTGPIAPGRIVVP